MSETADLASRLLTAEATERESLLRAANISELNAAVTALGHTRDSVSAEILVQVEDVVADRAVRKAARRELHRLRSVGVDPPSPPPATRTESAPEPRQRTLQIGEAWATDIDPSGSRALWIVADKPLGGIWLAIVLLNDQRGLQDMSLYDTTRKRFQREFEEARRGLGTWVSVPGEYGLRLVREGVDLAREAGAGLPTRYPSFRDVFGEAPGPPERGLLYETISPVEVNFNPDWLEEAPRLLGEPEVSGWFVPVATELRTRALEVARAPTAPLLVPGHTPEQQAMQLVADAANQSLTPTARRGFRRRLEETGYIFLQTDRLGLARLAAAAASALEERGVPAERHPLLRLLIAAGLARLIRSETVGGGRASEVLVELVERAAEQQAQGGSVETRPSGLILPR